MAALKSLMDKAKHFMHRNPEKAHRGVERAGDFVNKKTGGKYSDKIDKAQEKARRYVGDNRRRRQDNDPGASGGQG